MSRSFCLLGLAALILWAPAHARTVPSSPERCTGRWFFKGGGATSAFWLQIRVSTPREAGTFKFEDAGFGHDSGTWETDGRGVIDMTSKDGESAGSIFGCSARSAKVDFPGQPYRVVTVVRATESSLFKEGKKRGLDFSEGD